MITIVPEDAQPIPLVVIEDAHRDETNPRRVIGAVRVGGHPIRVVLDFTRQDIGFIEYVELPPILGMHVPSQQAVVGILTRVNAEEAIQFPVDLSEKIREASPPSPFEPISAEQRRALEAAADQVRLEITDIERTAFEPPRLLVQLVLDGQPMTLNVEVHAGDNRIPMLRWLAGLDPAGLSREQLYAIERELIRRFR